MKRKMLGMFLATVLMFGAFDVTYGATIENTVTTQSTSATIVKSGKCGDNVTYTLDSDGLLTISGSGDMYSLSYGKSPFCNNCDIKKVVIEKGVTSIGDYAFQGCSNLISIEIPSGVTSIGIYAFSSCSSLASIKIPDSVTSIEGYAFRGCSSLTSIEIPSGVTSIGIYAFSSCSSLASIKIPTGVTCIKDSTFFRCSSLTSVEIPNSVTSIEYRAFGFCSNLTSIEIPDSVTSIGNIVFFNCSNLNTIYCYKNSTADKYTDYPSTAKKVYLDDVTTTERTTENTSVTETTTVKNTETTTETTTTVENLFNFNSSTGTITGYSGSEKVVNIPSTIGGIYVKAIGENAFKNNTDIETVIIPEGVNSIEDFAFYKCTGLKYVSIPESVTSVSEDGFYRCGALNVTCKKGSTADNISLYPSGSTIVYYVEKGDINGDGSIDMRDVILLMKYVTGKISEI